MNASAHPGSPLTAAELRVVRLVADGLANPEIGARLWLSPATVKSELRSAMRRLGARNRAQAVVMAIGRGELPCPCPTHRGAEGRAAA